MWIHHKDDLDKAFESSEKPCYIVLKAAYEQFISINNNNNNNNSINKLQSKLKNINLNENNITTSDNVVIIKDLDIYRNNVKDGKLHILQIELKPKFNN
jgi:uncharacterized Zn ribbon protein